MTNRRQFRSKYVLVASAFIVSAVLGIFAPVQPAEAAVGGERVAILSPFVAGGKTGDQSPATHHVLGTGFGFAWDMHGGTSTNVYPRVLSYDGVVTMQVAGKSSSPEGAGTSLDIAVNVDGTSVGTLRYSHLIGVTLAAGQTVTSTTKLGTTAANVRVGSCIGFRCSSSWQVTTATGVHTHMEFAKACYLVKPLNSPLGANEAIGMVSQNYSATNKSVCDSSEVNLVMTPKPTAVKILSLATSVSGRAVTWTITVERPTFLPPASSGNLSGLNFRCYPDPATPWVLSTGGTLYSEDERTALTNYTATYTHVIDFSTAAPGTWGQCETYNIYATDSTGLHAEYGSTDPRGPNTNPLGGSFVLPQA